jgi:catechol 2,3-dioxygenase-like lactoylglutathione lyase family enzyme
MVSKVGNVVFYAEDPRALSHFWSAVLGYPPLEFEGEFKEQLLASGLTEQDLAHRGLAEDPTGAGPRLLFHHADGPKTGRNRLHLDIRATPGRAPTHEELEAEKDRIVALGATVVRLVDQQWGPAREHYYQMRDPEGNEFCID